MSVGAVCVKVGDVFTLRSVNSFIESVSLTLSERIILILLPVDVIKGAIGDSLVFPPLTIIFGFVGIAAIKNLVAQLCAIAPLLLNSSVARGRRLDRHLVHVANMAVVQTGCRVEPEHIFVHPLPVLVPVSPVLQPARALGLLKNALLIGFVPALCLSPVEFVIAVFVAIGVVVGLGCRPNVSWDALGIVDCGDLFVAVRRSIGVGLGSVVSLIPFSIDPALASPSTSAAPTVTNTIS